MTLFWFFIGILLIVLISRYNKSNKLFWTLFLAFVLGFSVTKMVYDSKHNERNKETTIHAAPTQLLTTITIFDAILPETPTSVTGSNSVSKEKHEVNSSYLIPSKVLWEIRGQPQFKFFDTS